MFVRRSEVSRRDSIHLDNWVTGAKAMASSTAGSGTLLRFDRTNWSRIGDGLIPGINGFQSVAGKSVAASANFLGPVRRSR